MSKNFYYVREFSNKGNMNDLDFIQRLLVSAEVTKKITGDPRNAVEIIFDNADCLDTNAYRKWLCYKEYCDVDSNMKQSGLAHYFDYAVSHVSELHTIKINIAQLNIDGRNSLMNIAFKAFVIAAAQHCINQDNDWFQLRLFNWKDSARAQKKRTIAEIEDFLEQNNIYAKLDKQNNIHIFPKKLQDENRKMRNPVYLQLPVKHVETQALEA